MVDRNRAVCMTTGLEERDDTLKFLLVKLVFWFSCNFRLDVFYNFCHLEESRYQLLALSNCEKSITVNLLDHLQEVEEKRRRVFKVEPRVDGQNLFINEAVDEIKDVEVDEVLLKICPVVGSNFVAHKGVYLGDVFSLNLCIHVHALV